MPSIGLDVKSGRGWGSKHSGPLYSISLGCICFWWIAGTVTDVLEENKLALTAATSSLKAALCKQKQIATVLESGKK
jgi:hypothetical protein